MKFMTLVKSVEGKYGLPPPELLDGIMALGAEAQQAGVFVDMGGFRPSKDGAEIALKNGRIQVMDGPFAEGREIIGGWATYDVPSKAEALKWVQKFLDLHVKYYPGFDCTVEVRAFMDGPPTEPR